MDWGTSIATRLTPGAGGGMALAAEPNGGNSYCGTGTIMRAEGAFGQIVPIMQPTHANIRQDRTNAQAGYQMPIGTSTKVAPLGRWINSGAANCTQVEAGTRVPMMDAPIADAGAPQNTDSSNAGVYQEPTQAAGIYMDYAATTPADPAVALAMSEFLTLDGVFGNPASVTHVFGKDAADAVHAARNQVAALCHFRTEEVVWTSGATESINLALKGAVAAREGSHIVTSRLEHVATLDTARWLESQGCEVGFVEHFSDGSITPDSLLSVLRPDTALVSLMLVNNETGNVTDITTLGRLIRDHGAIFHVDATQGAGRLSLRAIAVSVDLMSISGHKIYGPKGIGALCIRGQLRSEIVPQIHGGRHELGLRSGTLPTHQIVGMGEAAKLVRAQITSEAKRIDALDRRFLTHLSSIGGVSVNGSNRRRIPGILNVHFEGVEAESLILALGNVAISTGSACTSADVKPSHVLLALGYEKERALGSVRFSFGRFTTMDEIDHVGRLLQYVVPILRRLAS